MSIGSCPVSRKCKVIPLYLIKMVKMIICHFGQECKAVVQALWKTVEFPTKNRVSAEEVLG